MSDNNIFSILWYTDYLRIGYNFSREGWSVFPLFTNLPNAKRIWNDQIESLDEQTLKMRFIEYGNEYAFILYPVSFQKDKVNFRFCRRISSSNKHNIFERSFSGNTFFTFGTICDGVKSKILGKSKRVFDVKFMKEPEVQENSVEYCAQKNQELMRLNNDER